MAPRPVHRLSILETDDQSALVRVKFGPRRERFRVRYNDVRPPLATVVLGRNVYAISASERFMEVATNRLDGRFPVETDQTFPHSPFLDVGPQRNGALLATLVVGAFDVGVGSGIEQPLGRGPRDVLCGTNRCTIEQVGSV